MSDNNPRLQYSRFYDKDQLVLRGDSTAEVLQHAKEFADNAADLSKALEDFGQVMYANKTVAKPVQNRQSNDAPSGGPTCAHGDREFKQGKSKAGNPYKMWACPSSDRQDQCDPVWVK